MRADGIRLKNMDPTYQVGIHIMKKRGDAINMTTIDTPYAPMQEYINAKRREGISISHLALIISAYVRTLCEYPELNRFVVNKKIYARKEIWIMMVVLLEGDSHEGTTAKFKVELTDTIFDITRKIEKFIEENRKAPENNGTEKAIKVLLSVPGLLTCGVGIARWADKHGLVPKKILDISPFHISLGVTNLASIRTNHIYHHCYEFGTTSIFLAMGIPREVPKTKNGQIVLEKSIPIGITMDERICSGSYFASAFRVLKKYLNNPELLEVPPERIKQDPAL